MLASVDDASMPSSVPPVPRNPQHGLFFGGAAAEPKFISNCATLPPWSEEERPHQRIRHAGFLRFPATRSKNTPRASRTWAQLSLDELEASATARKSPSPPLIVGTRPMRSKKGRPLGHLHDSGHDRSAGTPRVSRKLRALENHFEAGRAALLKARVQIEEAAPASPPGKPASGRRRRTYRPSEFRLRLDIAS